MIGEYEVRLDEQVYERSTQEEYNPLHMFGCYGFQMWAMDNIDKQLLNEGTNVFTLEFHGKANYENGEYWALPLRIDVLSRIRYDDYHWYLSFFGGVPSYDHPGEWLSVEEDFIRVRNNKKNLSYTLVKTPEFSRWEYKRIFFEAPAMELRDIINRYWIKSTEGWPIQGLLMPPGQIERIHVWSEHKSDIQLLREIVKEIFVGFYAFPVENRHFCFYTNKLDISGICKMINPEDLQRRATEISKGLSK